MLQTCQQSPDGHGDDQPKEDAVQAG
jgi:hypothetical protein